METFSALLSICAGNSPVIGEFPAQRPVTRSLDVFFDLRLNKRLSKQTWGWWFETSSRPLWRHCNVKRKGRHFDDIAATHHCMVSLMRTHYINVAIYPFKKWCQIITSKIYSFILIEILLSFFPNALFHNKSALIRKRLCLRTGHKLSSETVIHVTHSLTDISAIGMMTSWHGINFRVTGPLWGESIRQRWSPPPPPPPPPPTHPPTHTPTHPPTHTHTQRC